jgi:hypothetical protein
MTNCAMVPTTISDSAVDIRNQMESRLAIKARPSQSAANAHTLVIRKCSCPLFQSKSRFGNFDLIAARSSSSPWARMQMMLDQRREEPQNQHGRHQRRWRIEEKSESGRDSRRREN